MAYGVVVVTHLWDVQHHQAKSQFLWRLRMTFARGLQNTSDPFAFVGRMLTCIGVTAQGLV